MNGPQVTFFGRLTRDPQEMRYTPNEGLPYLTVGVAVNTYRGPDEEPEVHYYDVTLWRRHAENAVNRCRKGDQVYVEGQYSFREYIRRDGNKGYSHEVNARDFHYFLGRGQRQETEDEGEQPMETDPFGSGPAETGEPFGEC